MVGTAIGARLARAGVDVCVVDRVGPAAGTSSSGEGNVLVSDKLPGPELALALRGMKLWQETAGTSGDRFEFEVKGGLVVAWDDGEMAALSSLATLQQQQGVLAELVPGDRLHEIEPELSRDLAGGVFYDQDCQLQPMLAVASHVAEILDRGGRVVPGVEVVGTQLDGQGKICGLRTNQGDVSIARCVVNAAGPWAAELARRFGASIPVEPRRGHVLVTEPLAPFVRHKVYEAGYVGSIHDEATTWLCSSVIEATQSGTILLGSSREFVGFSREVDAEILAATARRAVALFPGLASARLMRAYIGFRPATPDRLPIICADPAVPGLFHATGHEGAGIGLAEVTAELVEALVLGETPPLDMAPFALERFIPATTSTAAASPTSGSSATSGLPGIPGIPSTAAPGRTAHDEPPDRSALDPPAPELPGAQLPLTERGGRPPPLAAVARPSVRSRRALIRRRPAAEQGQGRSEAGSRLLNERVVSFRFQGRDLGCSLRQHRGWRTAGQRRAGLEDNTDGRPKARSVLWDRHLL